MPKHYCDYCDVFLTHDSTAVRKAHNSGRNHLSNVRDYYASLGHDKAQNIIDQITSAYESGGGPPPGGFGFGPAHLGAPQPFGGPPMGFGGGFPRAYLDHFNVTTMSLIMTAIQQLDPRSLQGLGSVGRPLLVWVWVAHPVDFLLALSLPAWALPVKVPLALVVALRRSPLPFHRIWAPLKISPRPRRITVRSALQAAAATTLRHHSVLGVFTQIA
ncbi:zf-U1-domain-containing protein [Sistotremastrum niveocremeum HHB9708]|uniref:U1 small nuclear ribonucleoprotein C n=2 Tax=Sistotremastraceae TaxID=3402574 RepID=A0A164S736_9AGAM|nr:zf-U1-domain-containing protein [Sistotremastrum niveocremeum HHB9708]KZT36686.1 zf-U1-domain-containing protein [Sistotremastrum suecicum HHB10207 ss-3]